MNWTGGRLQQSRNARTSLTAVQKSYFAKARAKRNNLPCAGSPIKLSIFGVGKHQQNPLTNDHSLDRKDRGYQSQQVLDDYETTAPTAKRLSSLRPRQSSRKRKFSESPGREQSRASLDFSPIFSERKTARQQVDREEPGIDIDERSDLQTTSKWEKDESPSNSLNYMEAKRRELLGRMDWTEVEISKPLRMEFPSVKERQQVGKRRRLTDAERKARREVNKRRFQSTCNEMDEVGWQKIPRHENGIEEVISVRVGSNIHGTQETSKRMSSQSLHSNRSERPLCNRRSPSQCSQSTNRVRRDSSEEMLFNRSSQNQRSLYPSRNSSNRPLLNRTERAFQDQFLCSDSSERLLPQRSPQNQNSYGREMQSSNLSDELLFHSEVNALRTPRLARRDRNFEELDPKYSLEAGPMGTICLESSSPSTLNDTGVVYRASKVRDHTVMSERSEGDIIELPRILPSHSPVTRAGKSPFFSSSPRRLSILPVETQEPKQRHVCDFQPESDIIDQGSYQTRHPRKLDDRPWKDLLSTSSSSIQSGTEDLSSLVRVKSPAATKSPSDSHSSPVLALASQDEGKAERGARSDGDRKAEEAEISDADGNRKGPEQRTPLLNDEEASKDKIESNNPIDLEEQLRDENAAWFKFVFGYEIDEEYDPKAQEDGLNSTQDYPRDIGSSMLAQQSLQDGSDDSVLLPMVIERPAVFNNNEISSDELALSAGSSVFASSDATLGSSPNKVVFKRPAPFQGSKPAPGTIHLGDGLSSSSSQHGRRARRKESFCKQSWSTLGQTHSGDENEEIEE